MTVTTTVATATPMEYARLGKTGLRVSRICLGLMSFGRKGWNGWALEEEEALPFIKTAHDLGINFFDTADVYSNGRSEEILGKAIKKYNMDRGRIVVATKVFAPVLPGDHPILWDSTQWPSNRELVNKYSLSRKHIFDAIDASLQRLGLDYIDLYQIHHEDPETPIEETMEALNDLVRCGKVRYIGASNMSAWKFQKANNIAEKRGWAQFVSMQNMYNLLYRESEDELIPYSLDAGIGGIPWAPLAMGKLAGKDRQSSRQQIDQFMSRDSLRESELLIVDRVFEVAEKKGAKPAQVALAWLLAQPYVTAPVLGVSKEEHVVDAVNALAIQLTAEEIKYLEEAYVPRPRLRLDK
ncbi:hypothetical protein DFQ27_006807 [Actinomortierella ambigua]|uniref:NADP-dependent oxidoreductase domain-containing protein n=1 Tax=Actinomortierella ambigua TaxID=1343610 RepID=A0A9P6PWH0_9FUNG|nr:hypothetical protein DFQ27_006807 [Actinomortierella ambigua]